RPVGAGQAGFPVAHVGAPVDDQVGVAEQSEDDGAEVTGQGAIAQAIPVALLVDEDRGQQNAGERDQRDAEVQRQDLRRLWPHHGRRAERRLDEEEAHHQRGEELDLLAPPPEDPRADAGADDKEGLDTDDEAVRVLDHRLDRVAGHEPAVTQGPGLPAAFLGTGGGHQRTLDKDDEHPDRRDDGQALDEGLHGSVLPQAVCVRVGSLDPLPGYADGARRRRSISSLACPLASPPQRREPVLHRRELYAVRRFSARPQAKLSVFKPASAPAIMKPASLPAVMNWKPWSARARASSGEAAAMPGILPTALQARTISASASAWRSFSAALRGSMPIDSARSAGPAQQPSMPSTDMIASQFSTAVMLSI